MVKPVVNTSATKSLQLFAVVSHIKGVGEEEKDRLTIDIWFCRDSTSGEKEFREELLSEIGAKCIDSKQLTVSKEGREPLEITLTVVSPEWEIMGKTTMEFTFPDIWALTHQKQTFILENQRGYSLPFCLFDVKQRSQKEGVQLQCHLLQHRDEILYGDISTRMSPYSPASPASPGMLNSEDELQEMPPSPTDIVLSSTEVIDHRGGTIYIKDTDIRLHIPPGALPEGKEEEITISIVPENELTYPSDMRFGNAAPIIRCHPSSIKFIKPVELDIPHCLAIKDPTSCEVNIYKNHKEPGVDPVWEKLDASDFSFKLEKNICRISITEFCDICGDIDCNGYCSQQLTLYAAGIPLQDRTKEQLILYIKFHQDRLDVKKRQQDKKFRILHENTFLFRRDIKTNLVVRLEKTKPEWCLASEKKRTQEFPHDNVVSLPWQTLTFVLDNPEGHTMPYCEFSIWQKNLDNNNPSPPPVSLVFPTQDLLSKRMKSPLHSVKRIGSPKFKPLHRKITTEKLHRGVEHDLQEHRKQNGTNRTDANMDEIISSGKLMALSSKFEGNWKELALRTMDLTDADIYACEANNTDEVDKIYDMFKKWKRKNQLEATTENLLRLLQKHKVAVEVWKVLTND